MCPPRACCAVLCCAVLCVTTSCAAGLVRMNFDEFIRALGDIAVRKFSTVPPADAFKELFVRVRATSREHVILNVSMLHVPC